MYDTEPNLRLIYQASADYGTWAAVLTVYQDVHMLAYLYDVLYYVYDTTGGYQKLQSHKLQICFIKNDVLKIQFYD